MQSLLCSNILLPSVKLPFGKPKISPCTTEFVLDVTRVNILKVKLANGLTVDPVESILLSKINEINNLRLRIISADPNLALKIFPDILKAIVNSSGQRAIYKIPFVLYLVQIRKSVAQGINFFRRLTRLLLVINFFLSIEVILDSSLLIQFKTFISSTQI